MHHWTAFKEQIRFSAELCAVLCDSRNEINFHSDNKVYMRTFDAVQEARKEEESVGQAVRIEGDACV